MANEFYESANETGVEEVDELLEQANATLGEEEHDELLPVFDELDDGVKIPKGVTTLITTAGIVGAIAACYKGRTLFKKLKKKIHDKRNQETDVRLSKEHEELAKETFKKLIKSGYTVEDAVEEFELLQRNADELPRLVKAREKSE